MAAPSIEFGPLTAEALPAVKNLLLPHWKRAWSEDLAERIFHWRFIERPEDEAILGWDGDRCVAMLDSCIRRYAVNGDVVRFRELGDWYTRPEYRGIGLQPMWMMMRKPEPMVGMGGTGVTRALLPRMNWKQMPQQVGDFLLRLSSGVLLERPLQRLPVPGKARLVRLAHRVSVPIRRVRRQAPPDRDAGVKRIEAPDFDVNVHPARGDYALARLVEPSELSWLYSAPPEMGGFRALLFSSGGKPVGLSVSRLFSPGGYQAAYIMHVLATEASSARYAWMVSETAADLARRGATAIRCRTSCPRLKEALRKVAFFEYSSLHPRWWSRDLEAPTGEVLLSWLRGDDALLPYPA
jgi:hypothetical protein